VILRADPPQYLRERRAFIREAEGALQIPRRYRFKPLWDIVLQWAADYTAKRIAALHTAFGLAPDMFVVKEAINLFEILQPLRHFRFFRLLPLGFGKRLHIQSFLF
jgi:hypothetical protein